jgi:hypothetical protein
MSYSTIDKPTDYFSTNLWVADDASSRALTGFGHQPDLVWTKHRGSGATYHTLTDSVRGGDKQISTPTNAAESNGAHGKISSFDSDGITVIDGTNATYPRLTFNEFDPFGSSVGGNYLGLSWKAGGSASSNSDGSVTSSVSANQDAGFSIATYTGTGSGATVGHGLGTTPAWVLVKERGASGESWNNFHQSLGAGKTIMLNLTNAEQSSSTIWNNTAPTSSVFSVGADAGSNGSSKTYVAYCFAEKKGYSKFGSYVGNSSTDGTFVYLGFKPAWVLIKETGTGTQDWNMNTGKINGYNVQDDYLAPNEAAAEVDGGGLKLDMLSNGFKLRANAQGVNTAYTYIYMAFAESPFVGSNFVPNNAR